MKKKSIHISHPFPHLFLGFSVELAPYLINLFLLKTRKFITFTIFAGPKGKHSLSFLLMRCKFLLCQYVKILCYGKPRNIKIRLSKTAFSVTVCKFCFFYHPSGKFFFLLDPEAKTLAAKLWSTQRPWTSLCLFEAICYNTLQKKVAF